MSQQISLLADRSWLKENIEIWVEAVETKKNVGPENNEVFQRGLIQSIDFKSNTASILKLSNEDNKPTKETLTANFGQIYQTNKMSNEGFDDMVDMENLNEAELLYNIKKRYDANEIFTYVGPTLLVVNPYQAIPKVISPESLLFYQKKVFEIEFDLKKIEPHVYALAALSMRQLCETQKNQAIVISGESGAGKTENTKYAMKFLTSMGKNLEEAVQNKILEEDGVRSRKSTRFNNSSDKIEDKILSCNPILEAFGNAKTVRNDNSSRFGKLVLLLLDKKTKKIKGAVITNYLLEKSRVIQQSESERNYHIFYHFLKGASKEDLKSMGLAEMKNYEYLNKTKCYDVETINDVALYNEIQESFKVMKFHANEIKSIWNMVAVVLHLGNLSYDESTFDSQNNKPCTIANRDIFQKIVELLAVDEKALEEALTHKTRKINANIYKTPISKLDCQSNRDSFTKSLYERLFNYLIKRLNWSISTPEYRSIDVEQLISDKSRFSIGLLDIFGFEVFKKNSFEQLCINFANEKLQQLYISYVFKAEINEFIKEGLKEFLCELTFKDNQQIIDLLEATPLGLFNLLDESSAIASTDESLLNNMIKHHKMNENFKTPKGTRECFIIVHTAKDVEYNVTGFRIKNKDELASELEKALNSSTSPTISNIFNCILDNGKVRAEEEKLTESQAKSKNDKFLGAKFRGQMKDLMGELNSCDVHFIRCIKPNEAKKKNFFVPLLALNQIRYLGVLDSIKVRKESYPIRIKYATFFERFSELDIEYQRARFEDLKNQNADFKEITKKIVNKTAKNMGSNLILFGNTKLFLRGAANIFFENALIERIKFKDKMARKIQNSYFRLKKRKLLKIIFKSIKRIQTLYRVRNEYKKFREKQKKIRILQKWFKKQIFKQRLAAALEIFRRKRQLVSKIASFHRMKTQRTQYKEIVISTLKINKYVRGFLARRKLANLKFCKSLLTSGKVFENAWKIIRRKWEQEAAIVIQRFARGYITRKKNKKQVDHMKKFRQDRAEEKAGLLISRIAKGHIVRSRNRHRVYAASKIKGFIKMKWLSALFQNLKRSVRIIQCVTKKWLLNRHAMKEKWNNFKNSDMNYFENMRQNEYKNLFKKELNDEFVLQTTLQNNKGPNSLMTNFGSKNLKSKQKTKISSPIVVKKSGSPPKSHEKKLGSIDNEEDFMKYLDQLNEEENAPLEEFKENPKNGNESEMFDEDLCDRLITYESNNNSKATKEKKSMNLDMDGRKIVLFSVILDLELISDVSDIYKPLWSDCLAKSRVMSEKNNNFIQLVEFGESFTVVGTDSGMLYSWGNNEFNQLGRKTETDIEVISSVSAINLDPEWKQPQKIIAGDDHCFFIDVEKNVYCWGDNYFGQMGMGNNKIYSGINRNTFLPPKKVIDIQSKGQTNLCLLDDGKILFWPFQKSTGKFLYKPIEIPMPTHITISMISVGNNFAVLLSSGGLVYTFGKENSEGQLGLGDNLPRTLPSLIVCLKTNKEIVKSISCGFKHVIAKTGQGKVFVWGAGDFGQLGLGTLTHELSPKQVNTDRLTSLKVKVTQAKAGFRSSMILLENGNIFWWGTTCKIKTCPNPMAFDYFSKIDLGTEEEKAINFIPIRLCSSWSKTMGIFYATMADTREIDKSKHQLVIKKVCNTLTSYWEEQSIDPPFIDSVTRHFSFKALKKIILRQPAEKVQKANDLNYLTNNKKLTKEEKEKVLNVFSILDFDHETSPKIPQNIVHNNFLRVKSPNRLEKFIENNKEEKLKKIKNKVINLLKTPKTAWNEEEQKLMQILSDPKIMTLIKNI